MARKDLAQSRRCQVQRGDSREDARDHRGVRLAAGKAPRVRVRACVRACACACPRLPRTYACASASVPCQNIPVVRIGAVFCLCFVCVLLFFVLLCVADGRGGCSPNSSFMCFVSFAVLCVCFRRVSSCCTRWAAAPAPASGRLYSRYSSCMLYGRRWCWMFPWVAAWARTGYWFTSPYLKLPRPAPPLGRLSSALTRRSARVSTRGRINSLLAWGQMLADTYPSVYRFATSVFPSADDDVITSPYNSVLAMRCLSEFVRSACTD